MTCTHDHHSGLGGNGRDANEKDGRRLLAAFCVIAVFMVVEIIGGVISGSLALLADAAHMFTDAFALGLAAGAQWFANRPADARRHFGYGRGQVLAAFVNGILLSILLVWIIFEAVARVASPQEIAWRPMLAVATLGLVANGVAFRILHASVGTNINVRGAMLHVISDLLGSLAAIVAALSIAVFGAFWVDPLLSILVAGLIARSAYKLLVETGHILLQGAPSDVDVGRLGRSIEALSPEIEDVHDVQIWQMNPGDARVVLHVRLSEAAEPQPILERVKKTLSDEFGISESTVQIEVGRNCPGCGAAAARGSDEGAEAQEAGSPPSVVVEG